MAVCSCANNRSRIKECSIINSQPQTMAMVCLSQQAMVSVGRQSVCLIPIHMITCSYEVVTVVLDKSFNFLLIHYSPIAPSTLLAHYLHFSHICFTWDIFNLLTHSWHLHNYQQCLDSNASQSNGGQPGQPLVDYSDDPISQLLFRPKLMRILE